MQRRSFVAGLAVALLLGSCAGDASPPPPPPRDLGAEELVAQVASYDLAAGRETRFLVGVVTTTNEFITVDTVAFRFSFLGETEASGEPEPAGEATASFLPLPEGHEHEEEVIAGEEAPHPPGVYAVEATTFERHGIYEVEVIADVDGETLNGSGAFQVLPEPQVPFPGDRAIPVENLTVGSDAPLEAIDSRATVGDEIPDPELHDTTIADTIRDGRPALVVFSTPVFCVSRFCGPVTELIEELAHEHEGVAEFIHVEIWRDFQRKVVNEAAAEWLLHDDNLQEPWVFLIGDDGRILARWDNVATAQEIEPWLERLA